VRILIIQLKRIGDLILTTPAVAALRQQFPDASLTLLIESGCRGLAPAIDDADEILLFQRNQRNVALWKKLVLGKFDVSLDFTGNDRSALCTWLSGARRRITFEWVKKSRLRSFCYHQFIESSVREHHTVDHYLHLLRGLQVDANAPLTLHLPESAVQEAAQLLSGAKLNGKFFLIHPGAARAEKYWMPERWAEVIDYCQGELGIPCAITGGDDPFERSHIDQIQKLLRRPCIDLAGKSTLLALGAMMQRCSLFLSVDSGPMHLAAVFARPQIALFGKTNPFHWRPRHPDALILMAGNPEPVTEFRPQTRSLDLSGIPASSVIEAIKQIPVRENAL
jgi:predicted lipopolysaccharide heptosyltransferase III